MDDIYRDIYSRLYYGSDGGSLRLYTTDQATWLALPGTPGALRRSIDEAELSLATQRRIRLRPDAKFFLFVNLWQMVALPIQLAGRVQASEIEGILSHDINLLLNEASSETKEGEEVSGHAVLDAFSRSWKRLSLSEFGLWES